MKNNLVYSSAEDVALSIIMCKEVFERLSEREKKVFIMRIHEKKTFKEIGNNLQVSEKRAQQIYRYMIRKIRKIVVFEYGTKQANLVVPNNSLQEFKKRL